MCSACSGLTGASGNTFGAFAIQLWEPVSVETT